MGIRESSVLGVIPEGWEVEPLSCHARFWKGLGITKADLVEEGARVISYGQIHSKGNTGIHTGDELFRRVPWSVANAGLSAKLEVGDIVFADTSEDVEGLGNEAYIDDAKDAFAGYDAIICRPESSKLFGKYLAYLAQTDCWRSQIRAFTTGVKVFHLTQSQLKSAWVLLPPVDEQAKICRCLDAEVSKIQTSIAVINEQASILERYKSSLIHEAVTKGLDRDVPMRPSGVEWIGDIPEIWSESKLKYLCERIFDGPFGSHLKSDDYVDEGIRVVRLENIKFMSFDTTKESYVTPEKYEEICAHTVYPSDLVMSTFVSDGMKVCELPKNIPFAVNKADCIGIRLNPTVCKRYIFYYLSSRATGDFLRAELHGATRGRVNTEQIRRIPVLLPPISEQRHIAAYLDDRCSRIDRILDLKRRQVDVLRRRRQSLIYEYVTGKRRVNQGA